MSDRRWFLRKLGLFGVGIPLLPNVLDVLIPEQTKKNALKELLVCPVQLGISNRGRDAEKSINSWKDKLYIAEFEPRRCAHTHRLMNGKTVEEWGWCDSYRHGPGMPLASFKPDDQDDLYDHIPCSFTITIGRFEDGTPIWEDILRYPKFKERYPNLFDGFQKMKQNNRMENKAFHDDAEFIGRFQ